MSKKYNDFQYFVLMTNSELFRNIKLQICHTILLFSFLHFFPFLSFLVPIALPGIAGSQSTACVPLCHSLLPKQSVQYNSTLLSVFRLGLLVAMGDVERGVRSWQINSW